MASAKSSNFEKLIDPTKYQVFLFACPAHVPAHFAIHPWFVVNKKGNLSRWEIRYKKNSITEEYLHLNNLAPFQGIGVFAFSQKPEWQAKLLGSIGGNEDSTSKKIIDFIETSKNTYPHRTEYRVHKENSVTYVSWVLSHFPEWKVRFPWNTIGKRYE